MPLSARYHILVFFLVPTGIGGYNCASAAPTAAVGRIVGIGGTVLWRANASAKPVRLDPKNDLSRVLHPEEEVQASGRGSSLRLRVGGRPTTILGPSRWYPIPHLFSQARSDKARALAEMAKRAGRARGEAEGGLDLDRLSQEVLPLSAILAESGDCQVSVCADAVADMPAFAPLALALPEAVRLVKGTDQWDVTILPADECRVDEPRVTMRRRDGSFVYSGQNGGPVSCAFAGENLDLTVGDVLAAECLRKGLLSLAGHTDPSSSTGMRVLDVQWDNNERRVKQVLGRHQVADGQGNLVFAGGDALMVEITNGMKSPCRAVVLDVTDAAEPGLLWPTSQGRAEGETLVVPSGGRPVLLGRDTCSNWDGVRGVVFAEKSRTVETILVITSPEVQCQPPLNELIRPTWNIASVGMVCR